jgi:dihydroorotate dehydrogenase
METILEEVCGHPALLKSGLVLGVKLAPYFDMTHFQRAADLINAHKGRIAYVPLSRGV